MAELKSILHKRCPVEFDWKGEKIQITYCPWHESVEDEIKGGGDWDLAAMTKFVATVVVDWNLTDGGKAIPVSHDVVAQLPPELRADMFIAARNDIVNPTMPTVSTVSI